MTNHQQLKEWEGEPLVGVATVELTQRQLDWLKEQVADYAMGPTPDCLDESAVLREMVHYMMQRDYEEQASKK